MHDEETMNRVRDILPTGSWDAAKATGTVTLGWDDRHRRRIRLKSDQGDEIMLDLAQAARLGDGDGLETGAGIYRVVAAPEDVMVIGPGTAGLARLAYHLGNRHLEMEIGTDHLIIRLDEVIGEMVLHLGGTVETVRRPFTPEDGAYGGRHDF
jgi:urease accessory protein